MAEKKSTSLLRSVSTVSIFTMLSRITGVVRELLVATIFGAGIYTDAFNVANRIPNLFRRLFAEGAFSQAFVPVLAEKKEHSNEQEVKQMLNNVATLLAWVLLLFSIFGVVFAPVLVWLMASGLQQNAIESYSLTVSLTRIMFPYIGFMSLVALASGILNTWKKFAVPAVTPVLYNLCMIGCLLLLAPLLNSLGILPIYALAIGVIGGGILQLMVQVIALKKLQLLPKIGFRIIGIKNALDDAATKKILRLMLPALFGVSVAQLSLLINTQIASYLPVGSVSWLTYADRLMELPIAIVGVALGVVLMPKLSSSQASNDKDDYSQTLDWGLRLVVLLGMPSAIALCLFATPIVTGLYHYGRFTSFDVQQVSFAVMGYSLGVLGLIAIKVLASGFYANQDIKTPVKIACLVLVVTQLMNIILVPIFAHIGLALSIGLGALCNAVLLLSCLIRRGLYVPEQGWCAFIIKVLLANLLLAVFLWLTNKHFDWVQLYQHYWLRLILLLSIVVVSIALYFISLLAMGFNFRQFLRK